MKAYNLKRQELTLKDSGLKQYLLPRLKNNVFHITPYLSFLKIVKSGMLMPNMPLSPIGRSNSFALAKGWISFFDLRGKSDEIIEDSLSRLNYLVPDCFGDRCLYLILSVGGFSKLITNPAGYDYKYMRIPKVEVYYPEPLPLTEISCVLDVTVIRSISPLSAIVKRANESLFSK